MKNKKGDIVKMIREESINYGKNAELIENYKGKIWTVKIDGELWRYRESEFSKLTSSDLLSRYEEMLSLPLKDGSRLKIGDRFVMDGEYPFFSEGLENYNAKLLWCDRSRSLWYDVYPVSDRVRGGACGNGVEELDLSKISRRSEITEALG